MYHLIHHLSARIIVATIILLLITKPVISKCSENVCENIHDIYEEKTAKDWNFVQFQHWYPVRMVYLKANSFENYKQLEYITIKRLINGINEKALTGLPNLHTVVFVDNILIGLPKDLFKESPLEKIVIRNCKLQLLQQNVFNNLESLTNLKIENNDFREVNNGVFPDNLIELVLKGNGITYVAQNAFQRLKKLQTLDLSNNYISTFEFKKYLNNNHKLKNLQLSFNILQKITTLPTLEKLKYLYLDNNTISTIEDYSFQGCPKLEVINLAGNKIEEISISKFSNNKFVSLNKLYLSYNNLTCIETNFMKLFPNLRTFWVGKNPLNCTCYTNLLKYLVNHNVLHPYNYDYEWTHYTKCIKYL